MNETFENVNGMNVNTKEGREVELDLSRILKGILNNLWLLAALAVIGAAVMFVYTAFVMPPQYKSTASVYIHDKSMNSAGGAEGDGSPGYNTSNSNVATYLQNTYTRTLTSNSTLTSVIEELGLDYSVGEVRSMITYSVVDYPFLDITVTSDDPELSTKIANELVTALKTKVKDIVGGSDTSTLDQPSVPGGKSGPNVVLNTIIGFLVGVVLACGIVVIMEYANNKIDDDEYLINRYGLSVLASITDHKAVTHNKGRYYYKSSYGHEDSQSTGGQN